MCGQSEPTGKNLDQSDALYDLVDLGGRGTKLTAPTAGQLRFQALHLFSKLKTASY
jgi:hypothetical protein